MSEKPQSRLVLLHGRKSATQDMDDMGFSGPKLDNVAYFHVTYGVTATIGFFTKQDADRAEKLTGWDRMDARVLWAKTEGDCLKVETETGFDYYGDWEIQIGDHVI